MSRIIRIICAVALVFQVQVWAEATYPSVRAFEAKLQQARLLELNRVRLRGGPLKKAQEADARYLLELEPNRMLAYFRIRAGLKPKAEPYGGWDGGGRNLTGHVAGHYLSAVSLMWAATGNPRFKERADTIVEGLREVQEKNGDGYLGALEGGREAFARVARGDIRARAFDLNGEWSPWYTFHKVFAGLRDAYRFTGNTTALKVEVKFAEWVERVLSGLNTDQIQEMLMTEFGGMNEVMVDLYADTGNKRWLALSFKFEHEAFLKPLQRHQDNLAWKHANAQIPKLIGSADRFGYTGRAADIMAAGFFWDQVVQHHTFATGGHGKDEYFGPPDKLSDFIDDRTAETCNVYNMVKLGRRLFEFFPDAHYADFLERALFNHILASLDPETGRMCYMVPVGRGVQHEYQNMFRNFTCCVGTGMESHALHGSGIYYKGEHKLWVNLYVPSEADWEAEGVQAVMETDFPEGEKVEIRISATDPRTFTLALRRPYWVSDGFSVRVNGEVVEPSPLPRNKTERPPLYSEDVPGNPRASTYVEITRTWREGDTIAVELPKSLRLEPLPDNPRRAAILWGPLVLAGDLGPEIPRKRWRQPTVPRKKVEVLSVPVFVAADRPLNEWIKPVPGALGRFRTHGVGKDRDVDLFPFYRLHRRRYAVYWDLFTPEEWKQKEAEKVAEQERQRRIEANTIAFIQPGEIQPERDFRYQGKESSVERVRGRAGRRGGKWFSYEIPLDISAPLVLILTYDSSPRRRGPAQFKIFLDGKLLAKQEVKAFSPADFYDVEIPVPVEWVRGKSKVTVRFEAEGGSEIATVFGIRLARASGKAN